MKVGRAKEPKSQRNSRCCDACTLASVHSFYYTIAVSLFVSLYCYGYVCVISVPSML